MRTLRQKSISQEAAKNYPIGDLGKEEKKLYFDSPRDFL